MQRYQKNDWEVEGEFEELAHLDAFSPTIELRNHSIALVAIKAFHIKAHLNSLQVFIMPSPDFYADLLIVAEKIFSSIAVFREEKSFNLKFSDFMTCFPEFIKYINKIERYHSISQEVLSHFQTIAKFYHHQNNVEITVNKDFVFFKSLRNKIDRIHQNIQTQLIKPNKSHRLIELLELYSNESEQAAVKLDLKKIKSQCQLLLSEGEDPNQEDDYGNSALSSAVMRTCDEHNLEVIPILLAYKAAFFKPSSVSLLSAFDYADHKPKILNLFTSMLVRPRKSLSNSILESFAVIAHKNAIFSEYRFKDKNSLRTLLKPSYAISAKEREELYSLYEKFFDSKKSKISRDNTFEMEHGKFILFIRNKQGKLVGTVIYNIRMINNKIWVNVDLELFDDKEPNYGMMPIITYGIIFALQPHFPQTEIRIVFFSSSFSSFRRIQDELGFPKYQTPKMSTEILAMLRGYFSNKFTAFINRQTSTFYVVEQDPDVLINSHPAKSNALDSNEYLYYMFIGKDDGDENVNKRSVLVSLPVAFEFLETLYKISVNRNVNAFQIVNELTEKLKYTTIFHDILKPEKVDITKKISPVFFKNHSFFWHNQLVPVSSSLYEKFSSPVNRRCFQAML